jgi:lipoprotein-anchoring transpeptidase ErfK/SrfK
VTVGTAGRVAIVASAIVVVGGAATGAALVMGGRSSAPTRPADRVIRTAPHHPATMTVRHGPAGRVAWSSRLRVSVADGAFVKVTVRRGDGQTLRGQVVDDGTTWVSATHLVPSARYRVTAQVRDDLSHLVTRRAVVATTRATRVATTAISPLTGRVVGVGQPIVVRFSHPVTDRAAAERGLRVSMSTPVVGAWHWMSDSEVHYRPRVYWPAGEHVRLTVALGHAELARGVWGENRVVAFDVGAARVSVVDVAAHTMTVTENGRTLRVLKVSTGRDKYPTRGGAHIVIEKEPVVVMDSATVGIPKGDPGYYYEKVYWDVRISYGGAFVHSAPWSVAQQGVSNVSHGCVNLKPSDAKWFYELAQPGDIVDVVNAKTPPVLSDPGMADWNVSWSQWLAGSATGATRG